MRTVLHSAALAVALVLHCGGAAAKPETPGDAVMILLPVTGYFIAHHKDDDEGERQLLRSMVAGVIGHGIAALAFNDTSWGKRQNGSPYAFPSGHMAFATGGAAFLQDRYGWQYGVPAYVAAAYVGWVRVDTQHHRWRDIIGGAVLGWGMSKFFVTPLNATHIAPVIGPDWVGFRWERSF